jgi:hypothetical protein
MGAFEMLMRGMEIRAATGLTGALAAATAAAFRCACADWAADADGAVRDPVGLANAVDRPETVLAALLTEASW